MARQYRIAPYGDSDWVVQRKFFGLLWLDVYEDHVVYSVLPLYRTQAEAKRQIDRYLADAESRRKYRETKAQRRRDITPIKYP